MLAQALTQAKDARLAILDVMAEAIDEPEEMSVHAPRIISLKVPVDKIGEVIGPKGKVINQIQDDTGATLSIEDDGTVYIGATNGEAAEPPAPPSTRSPTRRCPRSASATSHRREDDELRCVRLAAARQGRPAAHQQAAPARRGKRVDAVEDVVSVGQKIQVQIAEIDDRGKLSLIPVVEEGEGSEEPADEAAAESVE